ncbi:MAG TPA: HEAT repeat domain-containing protein [Gemmataceae bacterium]|nr:HEAT repeat domain-containing protein [Gemmataceae bacterium]
MASLPRTCPECRAKLDSRRAERNGKVRCPECGARISSRRDDDSDDGIRSGSGSVPPVARGGRPSRRYHDEDEAPARPKSGSSLGLLVVLGVGVGLFALLVVGGIIAAVVYASKGPDAAAVAQAGPNGPVAAPVEDPPAAQPDKGPAPALPPAKEPIRPAPQGGDGPPGKAGALPLKELKEASVFIKATTPTMWATGSGFVVRSQGDTVYVVTNHHVVTPPKEAAAGAPPPAGPFLPRPPLMPRPPRLPRPPRGPMALEGAGGHPVAELTAIFRSGTDQEQAAKAVLVGDDADADLAVLKVSGVKNTPRPIDCEHSPDLLETMQVYAFGFPFGEELDPKNGHPAITVTKGHVSALRRDRNELKEVQLALDLNPGNSGGPVVDEQGALAGVAVAKIKNTGISFAVPVHKLHRLLEGRIDAPEALRSVAVAGGTEVRAVVRANDPLGKVRSPAVLYGLADEVKMPRKGVNGWDGLAGARSSELTIEGTQGVAVLALAPPAQGEVKVLVQVCFRNDAGQTVHGEPTTLTLARPGAAQPPPPVAGPANPVDPARPPAVAPRPAGRPKGEELTKLLAELKAPAEEARQRAASTLQQAPPRERLDEVRRGLQGLLTSAEAATRTAGVQALAACDPKEAAPALAKLLEDPAPAVRQAVVKALKELKDPRSAEALAARLPAEPLSVLDVLKAMGPAAEKAVIPYLEDGYAGPTRFWAFNVIKEIGSAASLPALEKVTGPDTLHVKGVIEAVRERVPLAKDEWAQALGDLKSADANLRRKATRRIAATPPLDDRRPEVVSRLETMLNDQSAEARGAAAQGLARWGGKAAVPALAKRLEGFDPGFHAAVIEALGEVKGDEAASAIARRVADVHDRGKAVQTLKAMEPVVAEKAILPLLSDPNVFVRSEAIKVLADVGGSASIASLEKLAGDNNVFYSKLAAEAVGSIKDRMEDDKRR